MKNTHKSITAVAPSTNWAGSAAPYTNNIAVAGVTANNIVEVGLSNSANDDQVKACMKEQHAIQELQNSLMT